MRVDVIHPSDYQSTKNGDKEIVERTEIESKEQLLAKLLSMSIRPEPAESACQSDIAFYNHITMIYGEAKKGKSFTTVEALSGTGALFIDIDNNGNELHEHLLQHKLVPLHSDMARPLIDCINAYAGTEKFVIVIDSFTNLASELGYSVNDTDSVAKLFKEIRQISDKGHALILIHHVTTNGKSDAEHSSKIQGNAGALTARVDLMYKLVDSGVLHKDNRGRISNAATSYGEANAKAEIPK